MPCRACLDPNCGDSSASTGTCSAAEVRSRYNSPVHHCGTAEVRSRCCSSVHYGGATQVRSRCCSSVRHGGAAKIRSNRSPCSAGPGRFARGWPIYNRVPSENSLPERHDRMGKYPLEGLSLRFKPQIRPHEDRRIHVRERNRSSRHPGSQEGEAPVKEFCALLLTA